jgi:hypothetical protein
VIYKGPIVLVKAFVLLAPACIDPSHDTATTVFLCRCGAPGNALYPLAETGLVVERCHKRGPMTYLDSKGNVWVANNMDRNPQNHKNPCRRLRNRRLLRRREAKLRGCSTSSSPAEA